jgi:LmbE family N-acetylglucosaminyl deacetylase
MAESSTARPAERVTDIIGDVGACLFVSPHLDDAVLSCGALMAALGGRCVVTVATVFTGSAPPPHTRAARAFLRQCGAGDARSLFAERQAEDARVVSSLGFDHEHLGLPDALFRLRRGAGGPWRHVPELVHRYPTFRFDIAKGRVGRGDRYLVDQVADETEKLAISIGAGVIFFPLGVGRHVDHLITRSVGERFGDRVVYYSDFPYNVVHGVDRRFVERHALSRRELAVATPRKQALIRGYATQADALFPTGVIPSRSEEYYLPPSRLA